MALAAIAAALLVSACNKSVVLPPPGASASTSASTSASSAGTMAEVSDLDITRNLTLALLGAAELQGKTIGVIANKGDVRLTAVLDNQSQIDMALRLAHGAQGVHTVHDELTLKP